MDPIVITWRELLIAIIVVLAVYVAELLLLLRAGRLPRLPLPLRDAPPAEPPASFAIAPVKEEVAELKSALATLREEVEVLRQARPKEAPRVPAPLPMPVTAPAQAVPGATPYAQAIQLARQGGGAVELARDCGISRGEAELIVALYSARH